MSRNIRDTFIRYTSKFFLRAGGLNLRSICILHYYEQHQCQIAFISRGVLNFSFEYLQFTNPVTHPYAYCRFNLVR